MKKSEVSRSPVLRAVLALACVCALFVLIGKDESHPFLERGEFLRGDDSKEYKFPVNEHEECVQQLTKMSSSASTSPDSLTMFPMADKFGLSLMDAKDGKMVLNQHEAVNALKDTRLRLRLAGLASSISKQHKVFQLGKQSVFIFKDNTVAVADSPSCMVQHVYLSNRGQVHPDIARKVHANMKVAQDKGRPPSGCNGIPYVDPAVPVGEMEDVEEEDVEEDEVSGKESSIQHEACADELKAHMTSKMELTKVVENGMVNIGLPDGSVKRRSVTSLEPKFRAYVWNRYPLMMQLNGIRFSHKNLAKGATSVFLFPDNTVVVADNTKCKVTGVYFSDHKNEIHPELQSDLTPKVIARADKKGRRRSSKPRSPYCSRYREGMCQTRHAGACKTKVRVRSRRRSSVRRSVTNACTMFDAGPRNTKCNDFGRFPWCHHKFCYKYHRPAYTCMYGRARCWVHTTRKHGRRHHRRHCGNYNSRYVATNKRSCPAVHCCRVAKCPLIVMPDCTARASQAAHHITDTSTAVTNAVTTVQTGLAIGMGVISMSAKLTAAFPAAGLVLGVFSAVLGFAGNAGMTGEQALQKSKEYTDKVANELRRCMDQKFALAWEQHMDAQYRTLKVILNSGKLISSSPNLAMQRMTQVWNAADPVCIHMSSLFAEYNRHHANRDNGYRVATKGLFFMQVCSAMYTSQMADMKATKFALTATLNRMQAVNYEIDTYIKWHCRRFLAYYTRRDKCANIPEVQVKYRYLEHNVVLPSTLLAQSSYGGKVTNAVVLEYRRRWIRLPGHWWEVLGNNVVDPVDCKKQCLVKSSCFASIHDVARKICYGSKRRTLPGNTYAINRQSTVYLIMSRADSAVDLKPNSRSSCCDSQGQPHRSMCMHACYGHRHCVGSRFYRGRCYYAWTNGRRDIRDLDYVIVRRAKVVMMKGFAYHGSWPNHAPYRIHANSRSDCVALCAARGNCVALDVYPHGGRVVCNLCYANTFYPEANKYLKPWAGQPNGYHFDLYRTNLNRIYAPFLTTYTNIQIGKGARPARRPVVKEEKMVMPQIEEAVDA